MLAFSSGPGEHIGAAEQEYGNQRDGHQEPLRGIRLVPLGLDVHRRPVGLGLFAAHEVWEVSEEERLAAKALAGEEID